MKWHRQIALAGALMALGGCAGQTPLAGSGAGPPPATAFVLSPGDKIKVATYGEEKLTGDFEVSPAGTIAFPLIGEVKDLREGSCDMVAGRDWPFSIPEFKAALEANSRRRGTTALRPVTVLLVDTGYDPRMLGKAIPDASLGEVESFVSGAIARIGVNTAEQNNDPDAPEGLASSLNGIEGDQPH